MERTLEILQAFLKGVLDSLKGGIYLFTLDKQLEKQLQHDVSPRKATSKPPISSRKPRVLRCTLMTCALNGGVFWLSRVLFYNVLLPFLEYFISISLSTTQSGLVWSYTSPILSLIFSAMWVLPIFLLSKLLNSLWFQDIADAAYQVRRGTPCTVPSLSRLAADFLLGIFTQALFLVQALTIALLPINGIGWLASQLHMCFLYALYSFEYKWYNVGWELPKRLSHIENNWPYYTGFGLPLTLITAIPDSYFDSGCLFSIVFPIFIISANEAVPVKNNSSLPLRLFSPVVSITDALFRKTLGQKATVRASSSQR